MEAACQFHIFTIFSTQMLFRINPFRGKKPVIFSLGEVRKCIMFLKLYFESRILCKLLRWGSGFVKLLGHQTFKKSRKEKQPRTFDSFCVFRVFSRGLWTATNRRWKNDDFTELCVWRVPHLVNNSQGFEQILGLRQKHLETETVVIYVFSFFVSSAWRRRLSASALLASFASQTMSQAQAPRVYVSQLRLIDVFLNARM